ncbi:hypothetical protein MACK_004166 (apicoplast) [Theileria orientalis]|uniref:Uncharacterized protein n=1 Tax=Theileria orientalis TaxID=68886 RepID=A0A976SI42_THEOR|nr:hypothetical protein MACK_004166 [Theileria orientalis]
MTNCNLIIIKAISVFLIYIYSNFTKTLISIISYLTIKFVIYITTKSVKQVKYENTLTGGTITYISYLNKKYGKVVKCILHFSYSVPLLILRIFSRYFSTNPIIIFNVVNFSSGFGLIMSIFSFFYAILKAYITFDLKNLFSISLNKNELEHIYELFKTINNTYM